MISKPDEFNDLLGMLDEGLMDDGQIYMANLLKKAENDPVLQQRLADYLKRESGIVISNSESSPKEIIEHWRKCLALGILKGTPKEKLT